MKNAFIETINKSHQLEASVEKLTKERESFVKELDEVKTLQKHILGSSHNKHDLNQRTRSRSPKNKRRSASPPTINTKQTPINPPQQPTYDSNIETLPNTSDEEYRADMETDEDNSNNHTNHNNVSSLYDNISKYWPYGRRED